MPRPRRRTGPSRAWPGSSPSFRFLDRVGRPGPAAAALVALVERLAPRWTADSEDLREGAQRVAAHLPDAAPEARAATAFRLLERIVEAEAWGGLPAERRLSDLEHWATFARDSKEADARRAVRALVGELPELAPEEAYADGGVPGIAAHPLASLCTTRADHGRLLQALALVREPEPSAPPEGEPIEEVPSPPSNGNGPGEDASGGEGGSPTDGGANSGDGPSGGDGVFGRSARS